MLPFIQLVEVRIGDMNEGHQGGWICDWKIKRSLVMFDQRDAVPRLEYSFYSVQSVILPVYHGNFLLVFLSVEEAHWIRSFDWFFANFIHFWQLCVPFESRRRPPIHYISECWEADPACTPAQPTETTLSWNGLIRQNRLVGTRADPDSDLALLSVRVVELCGSDALLKKLPALLIVSPNRWVCLSAIRVKCTLFFDCCGRSGINHFTTL